VFDVESYSAMEECGVVVKFSWVSDEIHAIVSSFCRSTHPKRGRNFVVGEKTLDSKTNNL